MFLADICERAQPLAIPGGMFACNPSIATDGRGYVAIVRTVNYRVLPSQHLHVTPPDARPVSRSWWVGLDADLRVFHRTPIDDTEILKALGGTSLEDLRVFSWRGGWWALGALVKRREGHDYATRMALVRIGNARLVEGYELPVESEAACEKNWLLWPSDPLEVTPWAYPLSVSATDGRSAMPLPLGRGDQRLEDWRGSTTLAPFARDRLAVLHTRGIEPFGPDFWHRFVLFTPDWRVRALSEPFRLQGVGIEYVCGLAVRAREVVIGYGLGDASAHLMVLKRRTVEGLLSAGG